MAVSYTHLDVYKRQTYTTAPYCSLWFIQLSYAYGLRAMPQVDRFITAGLKNLARVV